MLADVDTDADECRARSGRKALTTATAQRNSKMSAVLWEAIYDGDLAQANKGRIKMILQVRQSWRWF